MVTLADAGVGVPVKADASFSVSRALQLQLPKQLAILEEVSEHASREYSLERALDKMQVGGVRHANHTLQNARLTHIHQLAWPAANVSWLCSFHVLPLGELQLEARDRELGRLGQCMQGSVSKISCCLHLQTFALDFEQRV